MRDTHCLLIRGWRFIPHSYAIVNQFQCLELLRRSSVRLYFEDRPCFRPSWQMVRGLLPREQEEALRSLAALPDHVAPDAELRISFPYDITGPSRSQRLFVFGTAEQHAVPPMMIVGQVPLAEALRDSPQTTIITPSRWSRDGFIAAGAPPERVVIVPHGVDPAIFRAPTSAERDAARAKAGLGGEFVFLSLGAMTGNKNLSMLLAAFAAVLDKHPHARLLLKGLDALYGSSTLVGEALAPLAIADRQRVLSRLAYVGNRLAASDVAELYWLADCYVAPYLAEGFNLPVLEAAACGLPAICTAGGPTDDFVADDFALRIDSTLQPSPLPDGTPGQLLFPSFEGLVALMNEAVSNAAWRLRAREAGPAHVAKRFTWRNVVDQLVDVLFAD